MNELAAFYTLGVKEPAFDLMFNLTLVNRFTGFFLLKIIGKVA